MIIYLEKHRARSGLMYVASADSPWSLLYGARRAKNQSTQPYPGIAKNQDSPVKTVHPDYN